ncbi:hypothetical protein IE4803_CH04088 [Rhizobium etli bv. phaseoli str. IE4803]|uniref:Uncharacterized protein n=1 Tax=Rhizobium etli bv. mimosae str. IE4771 TaxID=1432050 RepID=A0A060IBP7_RHIET|nr:hypothetical protein IE4771_CH04029 [Rhizobium sp. IE4771]AJC81237.1 hypothetical protein IE4803_CH04088 [Rhizobium etli bv. phaseoli str. IE4803]
MEALYAAMRGDIDQQSIKKPSEGFLWRMFFSSRKSPSLEVITPYTMPVGG